MTNEQLIFEIYHKLKENDLSSVNRLMDSFTKEHSLYTLTDWELFVDGEEKFIQRREAYANQIRYPD